MIEDVNAYVDFMIKNKISTNQFLLLYILHSEAMVIDKVDNRLKWKKIGNIYKWSDQGKGWSKEEIEDLVNKEYLFGIKSMQKTPNGEVYTYTFDQLILTEKFSEIMFINSIFAFDEILEMYPDTFLIGNQTVFTKAGDLDKVKDNYFKLIKGSILKHEEIKQIILFAKERGLCNYKIENFLSRGLIDSIRKMIGESHGTGTDI